MVAQFKPPPGFQFPDARAQAGGLITGLAAVRADAAGLLPPVERMTRDLVSVVEKQAGVQLGKLVGVAGDVQALASGDAVKVVGAVSSLIRTGEQVISQTAGAVKMSAESVQAIPIIGTMIGAVLGAVSAAFQAQAAWEEQKRSCDKGVQEKANAGCAAQVEAASAVRSRSNPTPSDVFRPLAYALYDGEKFAARTRDRLIAEGKTAGDDHWVAIAMPDADKPLGIPISVASIYYLLCGPEARYKVPRRPSVRRRAAMGSAEVAVEVRSGIEPTTNIPKATRARMWVLIQGILAQVEDPLGPPTASDGGLSLFAALQSIVLAEYQAGRLTQKNIEAIATSLLSTHRYALYCGGVPYPVAEAAYTATATCAGRVSLARAFLDGLTDFKVKMYDPRLYDAQKGAWKYGGSGSGGKGGGGGMALATAAAGVGLAFLLRSR